MRARSDLTQRKRGGNRLPFAVAFHQRRNRSVQSRDIFTSRTRSVGNVVNAIAGKCANKWILMIEQFNQNRKGSGIALAQSTGSGIFGIDMKAKKTVHDLTDWVLRRRLEHVIVGGQQRRRRGPRVPRGGPRCGAHVRGRRRAPRSAPRPPSQRARTDRAADARCRTTPDAPGQAAGKAPAASLPRAARGR